MPDQASQSPPLGLYLGQTRHARYVPFERAFTYRLFLIDLDIDRLDEANRMSPVFSIDKPNLFSFRRRDHGSREDVPLRPWAEARFAEAGIDLKGGHVRLVTLPRHLFYKFAPISLWFGYGSDGLEGIIYEVNNTFGETHAYVARAGASPARHVASKQLYVSPFFDVTGTYRFTVRPLGTRLDLVVENMVDGVRTHMANIAARRADATTGAFLTAAFTRPILSHGVSVGIHWEALKLWLGGARYRPRPAPAAAPVTVAATVQSEQT